MSKEDLKEKIVKIIEELSGIDEEEISKVCNLISDEIIDSLGMIELISFLEKEFNIVFNEDDLVAHDQYGVGIYKGLNLMSISTHTEECLTVEYLNKEILYIPIRQHHKLKKYLSHQNDNT